MASGAKARKYVAKSAKHGKCTAGVHQHKYTALQGRKRLAVGAVLGAVALDGVLGV